MKRLLVYLKSYKKECVLAPLFKMLEASFELFVPLVIARMIDVGIKNGDKKMITEECSLLILLGLIGLTCSLTAQFFSAKAAIGFASKVRHHLFEHLLSFPFSSIDNVSASTMITRMTSDVNQIQTGVNMVLRLFLRSPFVVFGAMIMAFTIDSQQALIFAGVILGLCLIVFGIIAKNIPMLKEVQNKLDTLLSAVRENLDGVRVIRAFCRETQELDVFKEKNVSLKKSQNRTGMVASLMNPLTYVLVNLAIALLIYTGAIRVEMGLLTQGQVVALYNYMSQILVELIKLANLIVTVNKAIASGNRIQDVFDMDTQEKNQVLKNNTFRLCENGENSFEFQHVSFQYENTAKDVLSDIDFKVKAGQTVGIIGGTGSGKSTLVHLIAGFYKASKGKIIINGTEIDKVPVLSLRQRIHIVMQKAVLFHGTVESNLKWGNQNATRQECENALKMAQVYDVVKKKGGLEAKVEAQGRNFSGGQKQRISIARAFVGNPEVLILDDSSSALDFATDAALRKVLREQMKDRTVFIVSQRTSSIQHADLILVLQDGMLVGKGNHAQLLNSCEVYQEIYESQFRREERSNCL